MQKDLLSDLKLRRNGSNASVGLEAELSSRAKEASKRRSSRGRERGAASCC